MSPSEVAAQLSFGCQVAPAQETQGFHCILSGSHHDRCCVAEPDSSRAVACSGPLRAYQCSGAAGCAQGIAVFSALPGRLACACAVGQCLDRLSTGRHQVRTASCDLLLWAAPRLASLREMHLPVVQNQAADILSRCKPLPGEWWLNS